MENREIKVGPVTYEISRVYTGTCSAAELLAEHIVNQLAENPPFDEYPREAV